MGCFIYVFHDLGVETLISAFYFSSPDLYFIVKTKMDVILHIHNQNHDIFLNNKYIKAY